MGSGGVGEVLLSIMIRIGGTGRSSSALVVGCCDDVGFGICYACAGN